MSIFSQNLFKIDTYEIDSRYEHAITNNIKKDYFFEDENFTVKTSCSGEFGGSLFFKDKKTSIVYECEAVCAIVINKIKDSYFVTASLAHMFGSTSIFEIRDPRSMKVYKPSVHPAGGIVYAGQDESVSTIGTRTLIDSTGVLASISFPYKDKLYHIISGKNISIAEVVDGKFRVVQELTEKSLWTYGNEVIKNANNHFIVQLGGPDGRKGYLDIFENRIKIYYIK